MTPLVTSPNGSVSILTVTSTEPATRLISSTRCSKKSSFPVASDISNLGGSMEAVVVFSFSTLAFDALVISLGSTLTLTTCPATACWIWDINFLASMSGVTAIFIGSLSILSLKPMIFFSASFRSDSSWLRSAPIPICSFSKLSSPGIVINPFIC